MILLYILILGITALYISTALVSLILRVPYVPTKKSVMRKIMKETIIKKGETFLDLGCGDGRMLIEAEKQNNVNVEGYEIAPMIYLMAMLRKLVNKSKAKIHFKNFFKEDLNHGDVIFCYLMPHELVKLAKKIKKECNKGTRIISNTFKIKGLTPVKIIPKDEQNKIPTLYFYEI
ncbi:50S ribosomal protein L11 methyltransferase [Patescibacteria group bacterium]